MSLIFEAKLEKKGKQSISVNNSFCRMQTHLLIETFANGPQALPKIHTHDEDAE